MSSKISIILGTRPEIIKMSPVIRACQRKGLDFFILHTGQHYSYALDKQIFEDLELPVPKYNLNIGGQPYRKQVGFMTGEIAKILRIENPSVVIVQGDTISVLAGALAAKKLGIVVAHHEAGLRSNDLTMVEETNRVVTDHISDFLFVPSADAMKHLHQEGADIEKIHFTGNTIVDAVLQNIDAADKKSGTFAALGLSPQGYFLASAHRAENVDVPERLQGIVNGLDMVSREFGLPVIFTLHPRTKAKLYEYAIVVPPMIKCIDPVGFLDLLYLEKNARLILTDSGGIQEEAFILRVPCVTLRDNTERPETVEYGANILAGTNPEVIVESARKMMERSIRLDHRENPFGDGRAGERIIDILERFL